MRAELHVHSTACVFSCKPFQFHVFMDLRFIGSRLSMEVHAPKSEWSPICSPKIFDRPQLARLFRSDFINLRAASVHPSVANKEHAITCARFLGVPRQCLHLASWLLCFACVSVSLWFH